MAQLAMAWVVINPDVSTALTGATRTEQLVDTIKCLDLIPKLTPEILKRIDDCFSNEPDQKMNSKTFKPFPNRRRTVLKY